jgi:hypothetical protein
VTGARSCAFGVALLGLALLLAGCGGSRDHASSPGSPSDSATAGSTSPTPTPTKPAKKRNVVAWVLSLGPGAPEGPPEFTAYRELQQLRCEKVFDRVAELKEPARTLYKGAARACLAAFSGRADLWSRADAAYDAVAGRRGELTCMDRAAFALLERLVTLNTQFPHRSFENGPTAAAKAPPCPSIVGLTPDHGPAGTLVRMTGQHLGENVVGVDVVDSFGTALPAVNVSHEKGALAFTMPEAPPAGASAMACVVVRAALDWSADGAMFTYESGDVGPPTTFDCPSAKAG